MSTMQVYASGGAQAATNALIVLFQDLYRALSPANGNALLLYPLIPAAPAQPTQSSPLPTEPEFTHTVMKLIGRGADANAVIPLKDEDASMSPFYLLHLAICYGHTPLVKILLAAGASTQMRDMLGRSALHYYASDAKKPREILDLLVRASSGVIEDEKQQILHPRMHNGDTPLHVAARDLNLDALEALVDAGADTSIFNKLRMVPLHFMPAQQSMANLRVPVLLQGKNAAEAVRVADLQGYQPLHVAARLGHADVIEHLISAGADVNACTIEGTTPLMQATLCDSIQSVRVLVESGANVFSERLLQSCAFHPAPSLVLRTLLQAGMYLNI
jgi:ankyrin repeat protein